MVMPVGDTAESVELITKRRENERYTPSHFTHTYTHNINCLMEHSISH